MTEWCVVATALMKSTMVLCKSHSTTATQIRTWVSRLPHLVLVLHLQTWHFGMRICSTSRGLLKLQLLHQVLQHQNSSSSLLLHLLSYAEQSLLAKESWRMLKHVSQGKKKSTSYKKRRERNWVKLKLSNLPLHWREMVKMNMRTLMKWRRKEETKKGKLQKRIEHRISTWDGCKRYSKRLTLDPVRKYHFQMMSLCGTGKNHLLVRSHGVHGRFWYWETWFPRLLASCSILFCCLYELVFVYKAGNLLGWGKFHIRWWWLQ